MPAPDPLNFEELQIANADRCREAFHPIGQWSETDWACAMAGEAGELCNLIKKRRRGENIPLKKIEHEAADVVIYLDLLCTRMGIDLGEAVREKFNIVTKRKGLEEPML